MFCKHCGSEITDNNRLCPDCGYPTSQQKTNLQPPTTYGPFTPEASFSDTYESGYVAQTERHSRSYARNDSSSIYRNYPSTPPYTEPPRQSAPELQSYTMVHNNDNNALVIEIILSLFGIFGVGWILARETTVGVILLVCSILLYWPLMFLGTIFTFGLGLICLGPFAITAIIINIVCLNNLLKRRATRIIYSQPVQHMRMPPRMHG